MTRLRLFFIKLHRKSIGWMIFYLLLIVLFVKIVYLFDGENKIVVSISTNSDESNLQSCPIPNYDDFERYPKDKSLLTNLQCPPQDDLISVNDGVVFLLTNASCVYHCIKWKTDFEFALGKPGVLKHLQAIPCSFFMVNCQHSDRLRTQVVYSAKRSQKLVDQCKEKLNGNPKPEDVIIVGIDSMAYKAFQYYLPKTFKTLHEKLNGISFKKFNTMGDGTTVNVQGLLTGTKDTETYEARRRINGSRTVDDFNWIWKHFKQKGYVTLYSEDMTDYGTFQYRLNGFDKKPTDFYLRMPNMLVEKSGFYKNFCLGNKPMHSVYFKFFHQFQKAYIDVPKFSFVFFATMSHDDNKYISYIDNDLSQFLIDVRQNNPEALIILYSDHGHRFTSRLTMEGKYEERLPFLGISLPRGRADLKSILMKNSDILISGLDVHATMEDIIGIYTPVVRSRHMSLLRPLPIDRRCEDIESLPHWCACLTWKPIKDPNLRQDLTAIAQSVADQISGYTDDDRELCAKLRLDSILSAFRLEAGSAVLKFKQSADVDGFVPDMSDHMNQTKHLYRLTLRLTPGDGEFDLTISVDGANFDKHTKAIIDKIRPEDVSRINRYAPWITCLNRRKKVNLISDIRKFCICKDVL